MTINPTFLCAYILSIIDPKHNVMSSIYILYEKLGHSLWDLKESDLT